MRPVSAGSTAWANTAPPHQAAWERAIIELVEQGDIRFSEILEKHVKARVITSPRAKAALDGRAEGEKK